MFTGIGTVATVRRRLRAQRKHSADLLEHLRLIVRTHQVCYEIWPVWSTSEGVRTQKGFELLLCGVNGHVVHEGRGLHAVPYCEHCAQTYSELREITEWILQLRKPPSRFQIHSFDCALHMAPPHRRHRSEIVISTTIFHPTDDKTCDRCLQEVRERLSKLGIHEDILYSPV